MNIRRGMFRFWILATVIYLIIAGAMISGEWNRQLESEAYVLSAPTAELHKLDNYYNRYDLAKSHHVIEDPDYRLVLLIPKEITPESVVDHLKPRYKALKEKRSTELWAEQKKFIPYAAAAAFLPPIAILALGAAIGWAFSGFRKE